MSATALTTPPEPAARRSRRGRSDTDLPPDVVVPHWSRRVIAAITGRVDGIVSVWPNTSDGQTAATRRIAAESRTSAAREEERTDGELGVLDRRRLRLDGEAAVLRDVLAAARQPVQEPEPATVPGVSEQAARTRWARDNAAAARGRRAAAAEADERLHVIAAEQAEIDRQREVLLGAHGRRLVRIRLVGEQLVAIYWRAYLRTHKETGQLELRPVPDVGVPGSNCVH